MSEKDFIKQFQQLYKEAEELGKKDLKYLGVARVMKQQLIKLDGLSSSKKVQRPKNFVKLQTPSAEEKSSVSPRYIKEAKKAADKTVEKEKAAAEEKTSELMDKISKYSAEKLETEYGLEKLKLIANGINQTSDSEIEIVEDAKELAESIFWHFNPKAD